MITFELTGCGGLQEKLEDGKILTIYKGRLIVAQEGKLLADFFPGTHRMTKNLKIARASLFQLLTHFQEGIIERDFDLFSRHPVEYFERTFEYKYRWLEETDPDREIWPLHLKIAPGFIPNYLKKGKVANPTSQEALNDKILRQVLESAFTVDGALAYPFGI